MNKQIIWGIIIGITITCLIVAGYSFYQSKNKLAFQQGSDSGIYNLISDQSKSGRVFFLNESGGVTYENICTLAGKVCKSG
jgi:hypothetical protein